MPKILHLTLKKKWFDMILSGVKKEEYREIKDYWARRFLYSSCGEGLEWQVWEEMINDLRAPTRRHNSVNELLEFFGARLRLYDTIKFRNGYSKDSPEFLVGFGGIEIKQGREEWGAEEGKFYFSIRLGGLIETAAT